MFQADLLAGARILVTGGGSGLGRMMAERFRSLGAEVEIWGRRAKLLEEVGPAIGASWRAVDIRDPDAVEAAVAAAWGEGRPYTHLVNNAAGNFVSRTEDLSVRGFRAVADIVFHGTFHVTHAVGRRWIQDGTGGAIVSILVTWVWTGSPFVVPSAMSKAGLDAMTKSLAVEWGRYGIRLNGIAPGLIPTKGMLARLRPGDPDPTAKAAAANPLGRVGTKEDIGNLAAFLLAPQSGWVTGTTIALDGGNWLLNGAGGHRDHFEWGDAEWRAARERIRARGEADKAQR